MEETKPFWQSKTLITNAVIALAAMFAPGVSEWIGANPQTMAMLWVGINTVLRFLTKDKVTIS